MFVSECLGINDEGHLEIGGCDAVSLAQRFSTPLYVMDEDEIRKNCRLFKQSIDKYYGGNGLALYASKAFCCKEIYRVINEEGLGADVVSGGEIYTAMKAGFPPENMYFHGNNKTRSEISLAFDAGVGYFIADNMEELDLLDAIAAEKGKTANIFIRIKPGIDAHTHEFIKTGQIDSKFGVAIDNGEAETAVKKALESDHIRLHGFHCHIGSQIFEIGPFVLAAKKMLDFIALVKKEFGIEITQLNLGGGFGIKYIPSQDPVSLDQYMKSVSEAVKAKCAELGLKLPFILLEPGRSIVASAGTTLYTIGSVKEIPSIRTYVSVDGGMSDNPRYPLYQAEYDAVVANKAGAARDRVVTIAGKCCENGDLIQENIAIQDPRAGDILAVFATGAYNYSMASNYNRIPRPAVIMVKNGRPRVIVKRESYDDLLINDI